MGLILTIIAVLGAVLLAARFAWHRSPEWRACQAAWAAARAVRTELEKLHALPGQAQTALAAEAKAYTEAQRAAARQALALEDLRDYGAKNVRWSGLREAGFRTLDDLDPGTWGRLAQHPGIGQASAEKIVSAARMALQAIDTAPIPMPGPSLERPRSVEIVAAAAASASAPELIADHREWMEAQNRQLATKAHKLRLRAKLLDWLFKNQDRNSQDSLLAAAAELRGAAQAVRESQQLEQIRARVRSWEARWAGSGGGAEALQRIRAAYPASIEQVRSALATHGEIQRSQDERVPAPRPSPPMPVRQVTTVSEDLVTFRVSDRGEYAPTPPRPRPPTRTDTTGQPGRWIPPGQAVAVAGFSIPGGMLYVGDHIAPIARAGMDDPALIHPHLPVNRRSPARSGEGMSYWPWYSQISEEARAAYLEWLSGGRCAPDVYIGYVFLFFYGLERRLLSDALSDAAARREEPEVLAEVRRLLGLYGSNGSFRGYATAFLDAVEAGRSASSDVTAESAPDVLEGHEPSLRLRIGLGRFVARGQAIPADWALAWLRATPGSGRRSVERTCREEFNSLFRLKYNERFGAGIQVSRNRTPLVARYQPASAAFGGPVAVPIEDLPDVTALSVPVQKLITLATECDEALTPFSRWVSRHPEDRASPAAAATLPAQLAEAATSPRVQALSLWVDETLRSSELVEVAPGDLLERWSGDRNHKLARAEAVLVAQFLEHRGVGIEPDVRFGGEILEPGGKALLFRTPERVGGAPSSSYAAAALLLRLGSVVAGSDKAIDAAEESFLAERVQTVLELPPAERTRLRAHVRWTLLSRVGTAGLKKRVATLTSTQRTQVADFVIGVAAADGRIEPGEIKSLQQVFTLLGLDPADVYARIHGLGRSTPVGAGPSSAGAPKQAPAASSQGSRTGIVLDPALVKARLAESEAVFGVLKDIFASTEEPPVEPPAPTVPGIWGLDAAHSALVRELVVRESWTLSAYEELAKRHRLMPSGALETVNEAAFGAVGDALVEGDDLLTVRSDLLSETAR